MQLVAAREPGVASLPRRAAAAAIDVAICAPGVVAAATAASGLDKRRGRSPDWWSESSFGPEWVKRWQPYLRSLSTGLVVGQRNWRSPGMRIMGIRRVDARTRGPVGRRSAIVRAVVDSVVTQLGREHNRPLVERSKSERLAANDEIKRMRASRPDAGPGELRRDSLAIWRRHDVGGGRLARRTLGHVVAIRCTALASGRRQTLTEWLAGTVVVDAR